MGGAGTAAGNDSAMPYLNPAGLAGVPGDIFGISASLYGYTHRSFKGFFFPNGTDPALGRVEIESEDFTSRSVTDMPSSVMYFERLGSDVDAQQHHHLGVALVVPSSRRIELLAANASRLPDFDGRLESTSALSYHSTDYWLGPSYALGVSERLRLGASLFAVLSRSVRSSETSSVDELAGGAATVSQRTHVAQEANALSLAPVLGFQLEFAPNYWLGAAVAVPSLPITGQVSVVNGASGVGVDPVSGAPTASSDSFTLRGDYRAGTPLRLNAGIARDDREGFSFAADVHYYGARKEAQVLEGVMRSDRYRSGETSRHFYQKQRASTDFESAVDFSAGIELAVSPVLQVRAGGFTDFANTPELSSDPADHQRLRVDRFGATLGLGLRFGSFDSTIGLVYAHGQGKFGVLDSFGANQPALPAIRIAPIETTEDTLLLVLSGALTREEAKKQIRHSLPLDVETPLGNPLGPAPAPAPAASPPAPAPTPEPPAPAPTPEPPAPPPAPAPDPPPAPESPPNAPEPKPEGAP